MAERPGSPRSSRSVLTDAAGTRHTPAGPGARIVSLVPSLSETVFALGLGDSLVGRTAFCVHPRGRIKAVKSVGGTKSVVMDKLLAARPTHVLVNIDETPRDLAEEIAAHGITVVVTHPNAPADNPALYRLLGALFGATDAAETLCRRFDGAVAHLRDAAAGAPERRVLYVIWKQPWMTVRADTYIGRSLALIGWHSFAEAGEARRYPEVALNDDVLANVDAVLFATEPFPFTEAHLGEFAAAHPSHALKARLIDGEMLSWYGSRAIDAMAYLATLARADGGRD